MAPLDLFRCQVQDLQRKELLHFHGLIMSHIFVDLSTYPFDWLEASFQYVDINNELYSNVKAFSGNQSLKDKSFDTKIKILDEKGYLPSAAIGLRDFGVQIYLVLST